MTRNKIRFIVILGAFAITSIIVVQVYWLRNTWNIKEKQFSQTVHIALFEVAEKMSRYNQSVLPATNPVNQLSASYFVVNLNSVIDANILEYYLKTEFSIHNIITDYEYAIYDCHDDKMVYGKYVSAKGENKPINMSVDLPKYSDYIYYFGINFPSMRNYLGADMTLWFIFTAILFVSVIFFVYSIFIILQQKRYSELQKDFINNMTHEFKTPISSINISADVLASHNIIEQPQRLKSYSAIIKQENQRLNNLVEKVLQIAHIEKGGYELKKEAIQLNNLITEVVENHQRQCANGRSITFTVQLSPEIKEVLADKLHLTNIIYNLLDNAVKYSGVVPQVTVTTSMNRDKIRLIVSDNGPGIDTEYQKKIFQKFFRIPTGNVHNVKGFGLGLYYVLKVCEAHGWKLYLESKVGKGSDFIIEMI